MANRVIRNQGRETLQLGDGLLRLARFFVHDPEIEPGMRQLRILLLDSNKFRRSLGSLAGTKQREPVVETLSRGVRGNGQSLAKLSDRLFLSRRVFIECFAQVAVPRKALLGILFRRIQRRKQPEQGRYKNEKGRKPLSHCCCQCTPGRYMR